MPLDHLRSCPSMVRMRRRELLAAAGGALLAACGPRGAAMATAGPTDLPALAAHPATGRWPEVITRAPAEVREAYAYAVDSYAVLRYIPCYCGCGQSAGHKDNFDCYVSQPRSGGWSVLDTHALN